MLHNTVVLPRLLRAVSVIPALFVGALLIPQISWAAATDIIHDPVEQAPAGFRIGLSAVVADPAGVDVVRAYFKPDESQHFSFVKMATEPGVDGVYVGVLPAPANSAKVIEYLLLVKNGANVVVKSQTYRIEVTDNDGAGAMNQEAVADNYVQELEQRLSKNIVKQAKDMITRKLKTLLRDKFTEVISELSQQPSTIKGIQSADTVVKAVEVNTEYGATAGINSPEVTTGTGGGASNGGTVTAKTRAYKPTKTTSSSENPKAASSGGGTAVAILGGAAVLGGVAYAVKEKVDEETTAELLLCTEDPNFIGNNCSEGNRLFTSEAVLAELQQQDKVSVSSPSHELLTTCHDEHYDILLNVGERITGSVSALKDQLKANGNFLSVGWLNRSTVDQACRYKFTIKYDLGIF